MRRVPVDRDQLRNRACDRRIAMRGSLRDVTEVRGETAQCERKRETIEFMNRRNFSPRPQPSPPTRRRRRRRRNRRYAPAPMGPGPALRLPWIRNGQRARSQLHAWTIIARRSDGLNVVKAIYMEVDVAAEQTSEPRRTSCSTSAGRRTRRWSARSSAAGRRRTASAAYLEPLRNNRHLEGRPPGAARRQHAARHRHDAGAFVRGVRLLGEWGLRFDLCMRPTDLGRRDPPRRSVSRHALRARPLRQRRRSTRRTATNGAATSNAWPASNASCARSAASSSRPGRAGGPTIWRRSSTTASRAFGPDRVMFAGDWPVCTRAATFRQWVEALANDRPRTAAGGAAKTVPRQRGAVLWTGVGCRTNPTR